MRPVDASFPVELPEGRRALGVRVNDVRDLPAAASELGVGGRPVLVVVGGASRMSSRDRGRLVPLFTDVLAPLAQRLGATVVDGGTDTGVMSLIGRARDAAGGRFPLVGVIVEELTSGSPGASVDGADLEPNHTHFVFVPGTHWGEEAPWLAQLATVVSGPEPSATVLLNGGVVTVADARHSIETGRRVVVLEGSGRTADALAAAAHGNRATPALATLAVSGLVDVVGTDDRHALASLLDDIFSGREPYE